MSDSADFCYDYFTEEAARAVRGLNCLKNVQLQDYNKHVHGNYDCYSCHLLFVEYDSILRRSLFDHSIEAAQKLEDPKFLGISAMFNLCLGDYDIQIYGCKHCMNRSLLDFGSDLEVEDLDRSADYDRELKNQHMHHDHHGSRKNGKNGKNGRRPVSRGKKYRDVTVV